MRQITFSLVFFFLVGHSAVSFSQNQCQVLENLARFVTANPVLNGLVSRYKHDLVAVEISNIFEAGLRQLFKMESVAAPEYTNIHKDGNLVTIDFNLKGKEGGLLGRMSFYYKDQILRIAIPSVKSLNRGDTYFPKFISGFYEGIHRTIKEVDQPIVDIRITGGMVVNVKLKERLPKLGFTKKGMNYSIITRDYAE
jgi:hypothetical protein